MAGVRGVRQATWERRETDETAFRERRGEGPKEMKLGLGYYYGGFCWPHRWTMESAEPRVSAHHRGRNGG